MKKLIFFMSTIVFLMAATPLSAMLKDNMFESEKSTMEVKKENKLSKAEIESLVERVNEIKAIDKSDMSRAEKKELRKEAREIKAKVQKQDTGIYIGGSTLLVILLLVILL